MQWEQQGQTSLSQGEDSLWAEVWRPGGIFTVRDGLPEPGIKRHRKVAESRACLKPDKKCKGLNRTGGCGSRHTWCLGEGRREEPNEGPFSATSEQAQGALFLNLFSLPFISRKVCFAMNHLHPIYNNHHDSISLTEHLLCARRRVQRFTHARIQCSQQTSKRSHPHSADHCHPVALALLWILRSLLYFRCFSHSQS